MLQIYNKLCCNKFIRDRKVYSRKIKLLLTLIWVVEIGGQITVDMFLRNRLADHFVVISNFLRYRLFLNIFFIEDTNT